MLALRGVAKEYGRRAVLRAIDLDVGPGEQVALVGPNGAGKSTLLQVAAAVTRPTRGRVHIAGIDALADPPRARAHVGWLPQAPALYPDLSPLEHFRLHAAIYGGHANESLRAAGLGPAAHRPCRLLSGGQRQRTALALATQHRPDLLLLDEPLQGLDADGRRRLETLLDGYEGAIVMATHDPHPDARTLRLP